MKKNILLILILLFIGAGATAQEFKATYTYDANGNRISATVIYLTLKSATIDSTELDPMERDLVDLELNKEEDTKEQLEPRQNYSVKIYPNPTQSDLLVEIKGASIKGGSTKGNSVKIVSLSGKVMVDNDIIRSQNTIDLSSFKAGTYILILKINDIPKTYKIIQN